MPIATAAALRRTVTVTVPGTDLQIRCRRPDLLSQIARGVLSQPLVTKTLELLKQGTFNVMETDPSVVSDYATFLDKWASIAAIEPRIVLTEEDAGEDAIWVDDLEYSVKVAILSATITNQQAAASPAITEFRDQQPVSAAIGQDGTEVRH